MLGTMKFKTMCAAACATTLAFLAGCASVLQVEAPDTVRAPERSAWASRSAGAAGARSGWQHYKLPGKTATQFEYLRKDGRDALAVKAVSSASMLRRELRIAPADLGNVRFSWKVPELIARADMATRDADDSPVRVILAFEGDRSRFSAKNAMLSELARAVTGEEMPYATLMYVWCNKREPGTVITSARTDRVRKIVVESGATKLNQWLDYERNIRADYERAFGEAPGALVGVAIMTDSDNTRSTTQAWYGPVLIGPAPASRH
ncbi:MAG: hypothetical protein JWQ13_1964 [Ramlibacter sp.]|jgi:hypothetical protein|nr:hypothetical protein [Ramlibacter sp.]